MKCYLAILVLVPLPLGAATVRVPGDFPTIQAALDAAADGDTVLVAAGEYLVDEPLDFNRLRDPLNPASPPAKNLVLRSEGGAGATVVLMALKPKDPYRRSVVAFRNGEDLRSVLDGFTLRQGSGTSVNPTVTGFGGGVYCIDSSPTLRQLRVVENVSNGISLDGASPRIEGSQISFNSYGGVQAWRGSHPVLESSTIEGNSSGSEGGGILLEDSSATLFDCRVLENRSCRDCSGGGIECAGGSLEMERCVVAGNYSGGGGGGISLIMGATASIVNCLIVGNGAGQSGGGIRLYNSGRLDLIHATLDANRGNFSCFDGMQMPFIRNTIFAGDGPNEGCGDLAGVYQGPGPGFARPGIFDFSEARRVTIVDLGDYRLLPGSPALDLGEPLALPGQDLEGNPRSCGRAPDAGAYERCEPAAPFRRGDANADATTDLSDAVLVLQYLFLGGPAPGCPKAADADDGGSLDITDAVLLLGHLFQSGAPPPAPFPDCGADPTQDTLPCQSYPLCV